MGREGEGRAAGGDWRGKRRGENLRGEIDEAGGEKGGRGGD